MKNFIKKELRGWKPIEVIWLIFAGAVTFLLSIYWKDNLIGILAALTGVMCVILTGKGKISSYIFGMVNTVLYAYIAFGAKYYGEVMLNLLYYVPMNVVGWVLWKKHMDSESNEVVKERLTVKSRIVLLILCGAGIYLYGVFLKKIGGNLPFVDSMSTVLSIVAQILCVKRYMEQWVIWIVVDVVTVIMWAVNFANGGESIATLIMWSIYLLNAIFMFVKWYRASKK